MKESTLQRKREELEYPTEEILFDPVTNDERRLSEEFVALAGYDRLDDLPCFHGIDQTREMTEGRREHCRQRLRAFDEFGELLIELQDETFRLFRKGMLRRNLPGAIHASIRGGAADRDASEAIGQRAPRNVNPLSATRTLGDADARLEVIAMSAFGLNRSHEISDHADLQNAFGLTAGTVSKLKIHTKLAMYGVLGYTPESHPLSKILRISSDKGSKTSDAPVDEAFGSLDLVRMRHATDDINQPYRDLLTVRYGLEDGIIKSRKRTADIVGSTKGRLESQEWTALGKFADAITLNDQPPESVDEEYLRLLQLLMNGKNIDIRTRIARVLCHGNRKSLTKALSATVAVKPDLIRTDRDKASGKRDNGRRRAKYRSEREFQGWIGDIEDALGMGLYDDPFVQKMYENSHNGSGIETIGAGDELERIKYAVAMLKNSDALYGELLSERYGFGSDGNKKTSLKRIAERFDLAPSTCSSLVPKALRKLDGQLTYQAMGKKREGARSA